MRRFLYAICILIIISIIGCSSNGNDDANEDINSFEIFLIEDCTLSEALSTDIKKLNLEDKAIISEQNISRYYWSYHKCDLIMDDDFKETLNDKLIYKVPVDGKPFVVVCNGERIYVGAFWTNISSLISPQCPRIVVDNLGKGNFQILYQSGEDDIRNDSRIKDVFIDQEKLIE